MKELTILMPCLNEAETIGICIQRAKRLLDEHNIDGEILISDNGSTDNSKKIAIEMGARVIDCPVRGYGAALQYGIEHAQGRFILMGDSDDSYHFDEAYPMIERLRNGFDLCMGTRLKGKIMPGAMPWLNRYIGNPVLTVIGKILFKVPLSDFHCGMRAFSREKIMSLDLVTEGMEWASEMVVKARLAGLHMTEVPITLYKDGRSRPPHLKRWRDGWRHLRFMLLHSPRWLFIIPGMLLTIIGIIGTALLSMGMLEIGHVKLDVHTLLVMSFLVLLGVQVLFTGVFARIYSGLHGILPHNQKYEKLLKRLTLEKLLLASLFLGICGLAAFIYTLWAWYKTGFSDLDYQTAMRTLIPGLTLIAVAVQGMFNGFMLSILFLKTRSFMKMD